MNAWRLVAVLTVALFFIARFAPSYAISEIDVSPTSVPTDGTVTITVHQISLPSPCPDTPTCPDVFSSLTVGDPDGNVWSYDCTLPSPACFSVGASDLVVTFPDPSIWTLITTGSEPNTGTDVSGMYTVSGTYVDTSLSELTGTFVVLHAHGTFTVPQFGQSILLLVGMMLPGLLLVRLRMSSRASPKAVRGLPDSP